MYASKIWKSNIGLESTYVHKAQRKFQNNLNSQASYYTWRLISIVSWGPIFCWTYCDETHRRCYAWHNINKRNQGPISMIVAYKLRAPLPRVYKMIPSMTRIVLAWCQSSYTFVWEAWAITYLGTRKSCFLFLRSKIMETATMKSGIIAMLITTYIDHFKRSISWGNILQRKINLSADTGTTWPKIPL